MSLTWEVQNEANQFIRIRKMLHLTIFILLSIQGIGCVEYESEGDDEAYQEYQAYQEFEEYQEEIKNVRIMDKPLYIISDPNSVDAEITGTSQNRIQAIIAGGMFLLPWDNLKGKPVICETDLDESAYISDNRYANFSYIGREKYLLIKNISNGKETNRWMLENASIASHIANSRNGKYVTVFYDDERTTHERTAKEVIFYGKEYLYKYDASTNEFSKIFTIAWKGNSPNPDKIAISECGKYITAVGVNNAAWIIVVDAEKKEKLWEIADPKDTLIGFNDACFSSDGEHIFVADNTGVVVYETRTGKVVKQWPTSARCIGIEVSPNNRLVAAGTGPGGEVYILDNKTDKYLLRLNTGQYTNYGLSFSPDSSMLATSGVRKTGIKIWQMPDLSKEVVSEPNNIDK